MDDIQPKDEEFLPSEDAQLRKAVQEVQAHVGALTLSLIDAGVITELGFRTAYARADRFLEERRTRHNARAQEDHLESLKFDLSRVRRFVQASFPQGQVGVILPRLAADPNSDGMFIRIVADFSQWDMGMTEMQLHARLKRQFGNDENAAWLFPATLLLMPQEMSASDPLSFKFDILARSSVLAEVG